MYRRHGRIRWSRAVIASLVRRGNHSMPEWSIKSPRELYDHLSQYVVGQEKAKRTLSVAVFNHYQRIAPPPPPPPPPPPASVQPQSRARAAPPPAEWAQDPSRAGVIVDETDPKLKGSGRNDSTKVTGIGESGDPTLTHDLLNSRSREGQWVRDGYFSSRLPPTPSSSSSGSSSPSLLGMAMRQRRSSSSPDDESGDGPSGSEPSSSAGTGASRRRKSVILDMVDEVQARTGTPKGKEKEKVKVEEVDIEKSNVLLIGPTGTGKTLMAKTLAKYLDVPFASCDATTYTQAGYVGDDVENCVLRLLQNAEYDVARAEMGIIHIDEIDKLARRGGAEGSWGGGRDVGGEGVQQALLKLLEGSQVTLSAKPKAISSHPPSPPSSSPPAGGGSATGGSPGSGSGSGSGSSGGQTKAETSDYEPPSWDPNNPMNRGFGAGKKGVREGLPGFGGGSGGGGGGKGETFVVDTSNILFVLSGAFVGLDSIISRRLGKGSIGFGAPLSPPPSSTSSTATTPLLVPNTTDLQNYGLIPEFLYRLPLLTPLHPLSLSDLTIILTQPRNALLKQYYKLFERYGSELRFTNQAIEEVGRKGLERGGGARGLRGVLEEILGEVMFEVPGSSVRYCLITERAVKGTEPAQYFSRGQKHLFNQALEDEDRPKAQPETAEATEDSGVVEEEEGLRATG